MGKSKYQEECLMILENDNFLDYDPTKKRKKKYNELYGKWKTDYHNKTTYVYGTAKLHKKYWNDTVDELPIRPNVSNTGTATYNLAKYLATLLSPLSQSEYTIKITKQFIEQIRMKQVLDGYKMVSFDVKLLLTNVPLEKPIEITLERIN